MGEFKVHGKAEREVICDLMKLGITFQHIGKNQKDVIKKVMEECEIFIGIIKESGKSISLERESIEEIILKENLKGYKVQKTILITGKYDATFVNVVNELCMDREFSVLMDIDIDVSSTTENEVRKELLAEALNKAKDEALLLTSCEGKKEIELVSVERLGRYDYLSGDYDGKDTFDGIFGEIYANTLKNVRERFSNSNNIKARKRKISEEIKTVWKTE